MREGVLKQGTIWFRSRLLIQDPNGTPRACLRDEATPNLSHCLMTSCSALSFAFQTEKGSALHEAALFGKTDVVQILLAAGERSAALLSAQHARVGIAPL